MSRKTWDATEVQGRGRRYWFADYVLAQQFAAERQGKGYDVRHYDFSDSVWVSFGKKQTGDGRLQAAGLDATETEYYGRTR